MLVCSLDARFQNADKTSGITQILVCSLEPHVALVLRDRKVLPEVRNQPLCQIGLGAFQPFNLTNLFPNPVGGNVGMFQAAHQDRF